MTIAAALLRSLELLVGGRVRFIRADIGRTLTMEDGKQFEIFRHVRVERPGEPAAVFVVRFAPRRMSVRQNINFSRLPMLPLLGLPGFREKYWCVDRKTGMCQGIYAWQRREDAQAYAASVALRLMTRRSQPDSVSYRILQQTRTSYWAFRGLDAPPGTRAIARDASGPSRTGIARDKVTVAARLGRLSERGRDRRSRESAARSRDVARG